MAPNESAPTSISQPVAFITGSASRRVGFEVARFLGSVGFCVALHARTLTEIAEGCRAELERQGTPTRLVIGDVQDPTQQQRWFDELHHAFGRLDLLVTSAAVWEPKTLEETTVEDLYLHLGTNVIGTFLSCQQAIRLMESQSTGGCIILIGDSAIDRPYVGFPAYFASKGSIPTLARSFAVEAASRNPAIRVNALMPGPILFAAGVDEEAQSRVRQDLLLERDGHPIDLAQAVYFLYQNRFITGVSIPVDGGRLLSRPMNSDAIAHPRFGKRS